MATLAIPTPLSSIEEQDGSHPLSAHEGLDPEFNEALRAKIQENLRSLVKDAQANRDAKLQARDLDDAARAEILRDFDGEMKTIRRIADEHYQQIVARVRAENEWTEGAPPPASLIEEQQAILNAIKRQHAAQPRRQSPPRLRSSSDASSVVEGQRGEQSTRPLRPDDGEHPPPERSRRSYGRQPATPSGSIKGGVPQSVSGITAYFNGSMHGGGPSDGELPELGREGVSRRPSKASMSQVLGQEIWIPPNTPDEGKSASRAFAYASADSPAVAPPARRDSFASSGGRLSRSGSVQSNVVQVDADFPSLVHATRERDMPEEPWQPSARAREKQREAQPQLIRPRMSADLTGRRNDDRPSAAPSPGWSQFTSDSQYPFSTLPSGGVDYSPSPTERRGIPIRGPSRASSVHKGSPESLRYPSKSGNKSSWTYEYSPVSPGMYGPQSLQSNLAPGAVRSLASKRSFTVDDDQRLTQASPVTRTRQGRRDSTGSRSLHSQRSRQEMSGRQPVDGSTLSPLLSDGSFRDTDAFDSDGDDREYGILTSERREDILGLRRKVEELEKTEEDIGRRMSGRRKRM